MNYLSCIYLNLITIGSLFLYSSTVRATVPNVERCCRRHGLSETCINLLCNLDSLPNYFTVFTAVHECQSHLDVVSSCLTDGRDSGPCCSEHVDPYSDATNCFALCDRTQQSMNTSRQWDGYKDYVACMTANVQNIYQCFKSSYDTIPGQPKDVEVRTVESRSAKVMWQKTDVYAGKVDSYAMFYAALLKDDKPGFHDWSSQRFERANTREQHYHFRNLLPDTRYEVFIVTLSSDAEVRSLAARVEFVTEGEAPRVEPYQQQLDIAPGLHTTLLCYVKLDGAINSHGLELYWELKKNSGEYERVSSDSHHRMSDFKYTLAADQPTQHTRVMSLLIRATTESDFGQYRCVVKNNFGTSKETVSVRKTDPLETIPSSPPSTLLDCCVQAGVKPKCMGICRMGANPGANVTPEKHLPDDVDCVMDSLKTVQCMLQQRPFEPCCIRKQVPERCLSICDGSVRLEAGFCLGEAVRTDTVTGCRREAGRGLPEPPRHVALKHMSRTGFTLKWLAGSRAEQYLVYYRIDTDSGWQHVRTTDTEVVITGISSSNNHNVVVHSANSAGFSVLGDHLEVNQNTPRSN